jgi:YegS/Rv2252/BmrU family lipid kinase
MFIKNRSIKMQIKAIINPKSKKGSDKSIELILRKTFASNNLDIEKTLYPGHATAIARRAVQSNVGTLIVVGGDGTINEVVNGMARSQLALGLLPSGTANDLACQHDIPLDAAKACEVIRQGKIKYIDLINVNGKYYVTAGGIGLPSEVARIADAIKNAIKSGQILTKIFGSKLYMLALLYAFLTRHIYGNSLLMLRDGILQKCDALFLMINNQPFLGKNFYVSPEAVNNDGVFDICLAEHPGKQLKILKILIKTLSGKHVNLPSVRTWTTDKLLLHTQQPTTFLADGELYQDLSKFEISLVPQALPVIIPVQALS